MMTIAEKITKITNNFQQIYLTKKEEGEKAEYNSFWDTYQQNGERTNYSNAFRYSYWNDKNFFPKYDIKPQNLYYAFFQANIPNLKKQLEELNVKLDTSQATNLSYAFELFKGKYLPEIDTRSTTSLMRTFYNNSIKYIDKLILKDDGSQDFTQIFAWTYYLAYMPIVGYIGNNIDFSYIGYLNSNNYRHTFSLPTGLIDKETNLSRNDPNDSKAKHNVTITTENGEDTVTILGMLYDPTIKSIIKALKPLESEETKTLKLGKVNIARLTEEDKQIISEKGWSLSE